MPVTYSEAAEVKRIATDLIAKHHTHLTDERIEYVYRSKAATSGGKVVLGKARKVSGLNAFLMSFEPEPFEDLDDFFVIEVAADRWTELSPAQQRALVDHELSHCAVVYDEDTGVSSLRIVGHDLEEFVAVVERNGLWQKEIQLLVDAAQQEHLPFEEETNEDGAE